MTAATPPESDSSPENPVRRAMDPNAMSFGEHLEDLRRRLAFALLGLVPCLLIGVAVAAPGLRLLMRPVKDQLTRAGLPAKLQATGVLETFGAYVRVSVVVMLVLGLPWCLWQLWKFVAPGLYRHEQRFARALVPFSFVLSVAGVLFLYFVMLPAMLYFLISFGSSLGTPTVPTAPLTAGIVLPSIPMLEADPESPIAGQVWFNTTLREMRLAVPHEGAGGGTDVIGADMMRTQGVVQQYRISEYVNLVFFTAIAFAFGFQTPVVVLLLGWAGVVDPAFLGRHRRYAVFITLIASAVLTPSPDPFSMALLALPLYALYELGMWLLRIFPKRDWSSVPLDDEPAVSAPSSTHREPKDAGDA